MTKQFITVVPGKDGIWLKKSHKQTTLKPTAYSREGFMLNLPLITNNVLRIRGTSAIDKFTTIGSCLIYKRDLNRLIVDAHTNENNMKDYSEYMQLIQYSVGGFLELSTTSKESYQNMDELSDLVVDELINLEQNTPIYLYSYEMDGKKIISQEPPVLARYHKDVEVLNSCAYQLSPVVMQTGIPYFKGNRQASLVGDVLKNVFFGDDKENEFALTSLTLTEAYLQSFHKEDYIKDGLQEKMIKAMALKGSGAGFGFTRFISFLRSISSDENDLLRTLAYLGTSVHEALNMVNVDSSIKQQILNHATFVAECEKETLAVA